MSDENKGRCPDEARACKCGHGYEHHATETWCGECGCLCDPRPETASHCEGDDWPPLRVTQATAQARREGHADALEAAVRILHELAEEWDHLDSGEQALNEGALRVQEFANTFKVTPTGGTTR